MEELPPFLKTATDEESTNDLITRFDSLCERLQDSGIEVKPGSRFYNYRKVLETFDQVAGTKKAEDIDFRLLRQANIEVEFLSTIVDELTSKPRPTGWEPAVEKLISGLNLPEQEGKSASPRDFQFELYVAAFSRKAGFGIELSEPDVIVSHPDLTFGIAAKRPKSLKSVERNIKKASKQIDRSMMSGVVAVDLSLAANPRNAYAVTKGERLSIPLQDWYLNQFIDEYAVRIKSLTSDSVIGIMVFASATIFSIDHMKIGFAASWRATNLRDKSDQRVQAFYNYISRLSAVI